MDKERRGFGKIIENGKEFLPNVLTLSRGGHIIDMKTYGFLVARAILSDCSGFPFLGEQFHERKRSYEEKTNFSVRVCVHAHGMCARAACV